MNFRSISATGPSGALDRAVAGTPAAGPRRRPARSPSSSAGFSTMPFSLAFSGDYGHLSSLFTELERFVAVPTTRRSTSRAV